MFSVGSPVRTSARTEIISASCRGVRGRRRRRAWIPWIHRLGGKRRRATLEPSPGVSGRGWFGGGPPFASAVKPLSDSEAGEAAGFLLETGVHTLEHGLVEYVSHSMRSKPKTEATSEAEWPQPAEPRESALPVEAEAAAPCVIANTAYNPGFWNVPAVQPKNNCYNYSMNYRSDTFAQPGRITGHQWTAINCANVGNAAAWDGCKTTCSGSNKLVALVIAPGPGFIDYHWYRRHSEGFWGHKPGGTAARNVDNSGLLINGTTRTPANCNRGPYTIFCGYRYSPTGMHVS